MKRPKITITPSGFRGIVGLAGLGMAGVGLWLWWPPAALVVCGLVVFVLCLWGELR